LISNKSGMVNLKEVDKGKSIIHLPLKILFLGTKEKGLGINTFNMLKDTCKHEATHLYHFKINKNILLRGRSLKKISKIIKKSTKNINLSVKNVKLIKNRFVCARNLLTYFLYGIHIEGIAYYVEKSSDYPLNEPTFKMLYSKGLEGIESINGCVIEIVQSALKPPSDFRGKMVGLLSKLKGIMSVKSDTYEIGCHMVYTILYSNSKIDLEKIFNLSHFQFIREYERSCKSLGCQPVISLNSGNGVFDYNESIGKLLKVFEMLQK